MTTQTALQKEAQVAIETLDRCTDFRNFLKELVYIRDVNGGRDLKWEWWPVHDRMWQDTAAKVLVWLKSRQVSGSWWWAAYAVWSCLYVKYFRVLVFSQGEDEAKEFLKKCRFVWEHLPTWLRVELVTDNTTQMEFAVKKSVIIALPSTERGGRGETASLIIADEADFHPYAGNNFAAYSPAALENGAQIVLMSTANSMGGFFHGMYQAGKQGRAGITSRFYGWDVRPGRTPEWYEEQRELYRAASKADLFLREYPSNDIECWITAGTPRFDQEAIRESLALYREPLSVRRLPPELQAMGGLSVWELPQPGEAYCMGVDSAQGLGDGDFDCAQVLHVKTLRHVATIHGRFEPQVFGKWVVDLCRAYNDAFLGVEHAPQGHGHTILEVAKAMNYGHRVYWQDQERGRRRDGEAVVPARRVSWLTTTQTKGWMIDELAGVIYSGGLVSYDKEFWGECQAYVWVGGGTAAQKGAHDDRVMAMAVARQMAKQYRATYPGRESVLTLTRERDSGDGTHYSWNHRRR